MLSKLGAKPLALERRYLMPNMQPPRSDTLQKTGERQHSDKFDINALEHLHRYALASSICLGRDVLDIASGEGYGSNLLAHAARSVVGVDVSADAIAHATERYVRPNLNFLLGNAASIPLGASCVDCVVSFETLEHHDLHDQMMLEIRRVLRPGGLLIMSTPDKANYTDKSGEVNAFHVKELYTEQFKALISKHFKFGSYYFQKVGYVGIVAPEVENSSSADILAGDFSGYRRLPTISDAKYNICLASDGEVPSMGLSIYDGQRIFEELRVISRGWKNEVTRLSRALQGAQKENRDLRSSVSYRIGALITQPFRLLRDIGRGGR